PLDSGADTPLALPFAPSSLLHAAHRDWLGFDLSPGGLDVPVHGFATDGRREVRQRTAPTGAAVHVVGSPGRAELHAANTRDAGAGSGGGSPSSPYAEDDYERGPLVPAVARASSPVAGAVRRIAGVVGDTVRRAGGAMNRRLANRR
ncbi:MAG: hypothetical protein V7768_01885, partial [Dietzia cercidiphylli]